MILHTIDASPRSSAFDDCIRVAQSGDAIVLLGDAVYASQPNSSTALQSTDSKVTVYALESDAIARGITIDGSVSAINIEGLVVLTEEYARQLAWY